MSKTSVRDLLDEGAVAGTPKAGERRFWTTREVQILRATYPADGLAACVPLLPGRTAGSIYQHAHILRLVAPQEQQRQHGEKRVRWTTNPHIDKAIREGVAKATKSGDMRALARSVARPRWWVSKRAASLGCKPPRFKEPPWTLAELDIICEAAHLSLSTLRRQLRKAGFQRSETAIIVKLKRLQADRTDPNHCTAQALAGFLGVDPHTVTDWIAKGWLIATRRGNKQINPEGQERHHHWIAYADVRDFVVNNAAHVDIRKVEKFWFIDLLSGGIGRPRS